MVRARRLWLIGGCFAVWAASKDGHAQDSNVKFESALLNKKPKPGLPDVKPQPLAWPRLDPGAVLCRTEADLQLLAARRLGEPVSGPLDCQVIHAPTAVAIVQRQGPGKTQVRFTDPKATEAGWTDVWLPEKAPSRPSTASH